MKSRAQLIDEINKMIITWQCQFCGWCNDNNNGPCRKCGKDEGAVPRRPPRKPNTSKKERKDTTMPPTPTFNELLAIAAKQIEDGQDANEILKALGDACPFNKLNDLDDMVEAACSHYRRERKS
jgi:hypothetical protein